jgi:hypothetical protein
MAEIEDICAFNKTVVVKRLWLLVKKRDQEQVMP